MKFGQLIEHNKKNNFLPKLFGMWDRETSSRPLFIFWKSLIWCESNWFAAYFRYISIALTLSYKKSKVYKTLDYWSRDLLNFNFSGNSFSTTFCVWFFQKNCFSCYIVLTDQISLPDCFYFSRYWTIRVLTTVS